jgi:hypothetical protein
MAHLGAARWLVQMTAVLSIATSVGALAVLAVYLHHLVTWPMIRTVAWQGLAFAAGCVLAYGMWRALAALAGYLLRVVTWQAVRQALASAADGNGLVYALVPTLAMVAVYLQHLITGQVLVLAAGAAIVYGIWRLLQSLWVMHRDGLFLQR